MTEEQNETTGEAPAEDATEQITMAEARDLWVSLDEAELAAHQVDMLRAMSERDDLEAELANFKAGFKKSKNDLDKTIAHCRKALEKGEELRQTACTWVFDPDTNTKVLLAPDGEAIETKAMTADDRDFVELKLQRPLPGIDGTAIDAEVPPDPAPLEHEPSRSFTRAPTLLPPEEPPVEGE